jgi:predicted phage terminase large subunit-like protein
MNANKAKVNKVARVKTQKSLMFFTRYFFKKKFNRKFVVNKHHEQICDALERVLRGELKRLIINIAPRYGKTELAVKNFIAHALSINPSSKFIHLSYSDDLALDNSEEIRDLILSDYFNELYPNIEVKKDSKSKKKWYTNSGGGVYATSSSGQVTGFGAGKVDDEEIQENIEEFIKGISEKEDFGGAIIVDDPIKPDDAESSTIRNRINNKFDSTIRNRVNSRNTPIIIIMQRLHPDDLCGHLIKNDSEEWEVLSLPCIYEEDGEKKALWTFKHTLKELFTIRGTTKASINIFDRQYLQNPKPLQGLLYSEFKTYQFKDVPNGSICNYTDTADTGSDYLCSISFVKKADLYYIVDVYYSQDRNEITEKELAVRLKNVGVNYCKVESNNGGRSFARNVERITKELGNHKTTFSWFHQSKNKESRIKSNSSTVNSCIVFPDDWQIRWSEFYDHVTNYMAEGKNDHDDSVDVLTGIVEVKSYVKAAPIIYT